MTLLPPSVPPNPESLGLKEEEENWVHNWLYSMIPADEEVTVYTETDRQVIAVGRAYLTGFCRECRKAFSQMIHTGWGYEEQQMEVPVYGCVKPGTYR